MAGRKLNPRQERFVQEYLIDLDPAAAYRRAGYGPASDKAARNAASRLLKNVGVSEAVREAMKARAERVGMEADEVLAELKVLGKSDLWHYRIDGEGQVALAEGAPPGAIRAVSAIKRKVRHLGGGRVEYETEIKLWSKPEALKLAAQHLGLLGEQASAFQQTNNVVVLTDEQRAAGIAAIFARVGMPLPGPAGVGPGGGARPALGGPDAGHAPGGNGAGPVAGGPAPLDF
jgi:phage terminase small subunit